jgi:hypothetical protein
MGGRGERRGGGDEDGRRGGAEGGRGWRSIRVGPWWLRLLPVRACARLAGAAAACSIPASEAHAESRHIRAQPYVRTGLSAHRRRNASERLAQYGLSPGVACRSLQMGRVSEEGTQ